MRKEQKFDWERKYYKKLWDRTKQVQKFLRLNPEFNEFYLSFDSGRMVMHGKNLEDLSRLRKMLKLNNKWQDKIVGKYAATFELWVTYQGLGAFDFIEIRIEFPYDEVPEGVLRDCYIKEEEIINEESTQIYKSVVCPVGN